MQKVAFFRKCRWFCHLLKHSTHIKIHQHFLKKKPKLTILAKLFIKTRDVSNLAKSSNKRLATVNAWQLNLSGNCKCLATANISQQTMSFRFLTESVWQLQMSGNCNCLGTEVVWQLQVSNNCKCLTTANISHTGCIGF